jgi:hypothetical protein
MAKRKGGDDQSKNGAPASPHLNDHKPESENPFESEAYKHSAQYPAFAGTVEFDLTFELFGQRVTRKARVDYKHTPGWEYYDLLKKAPYVGWGGTTFLLTVPTDEDEEFDDDEQEEEAGDTDDFVEDDPRSPNGSTSTACRASVSSIARSGTPSTRRSRRTAKRKTGSAARRPERVTEALMERGGAHRNR